MHDKEECKTATSALSETADRSSWTLLEEVLELYGRR